MAVTLNPLADRTYRRLYGAQVVALAGTGLSTVALALLAYDLAGERAGAVLGTALALKMVAYVGLAPVFGALAQRVRRRRMLVGLDLARAALVASMPFVAEIWQVYTLIVLLNSCSAGFTPTFQATIPDVLANEAVYTRALSLSRLAYDLENLLSPMLAAAVLTVINFEALFAANSLAFVLSAALIVSVTLPSPTASFRGGGIWHKATSGLGVYLKTPRLRGLLALSFAVSAAGAMVIVNTVVYVREYLDGSETDTAVAFAAMGGGSMAVALALPRLLDQRGERSFMLFGGLILGLSLLLGVVQPGFGGMLFIWVLLGVGSSLVQTPSGRLLARSGSQDDRPAIYAAHFALSHACWLIGYPLAGALGAGFGMAPTFALLAGIAILATLAARALWPAQDPSETCHQHEAGDHTHEHVHDEQHQHTHEGCEGPEPHSHQHAHPAASHTHLDLARCGTAPSSQAR
ncbi:MAG: MFS transporter [Gammaproteobacteria bacterium]|nr:MFS transporter [Gammaproteobacteria bacterium]|tara:strand:- start:11197 stop:12582 length:1386 start_codon:yes stop_codon:yes gene_type:complete